MALFGRRRNRVPAAKVDPNASTVHDATTTTPSHTQRQNGLFGQRNQAVTNGVSTGGRHRRGTSEKLDLDSGHFNRKPSVGQWLKFTWLDLLTMALLGAIGLGVYQAQPAPSRSFPVTFADGEVVYPQFAYPLRHEIVPIWLAALLASLIPIFIILCMQIRIRSFWDANNAILGLLYSLISAAVFQVFLKWLIGGLRPHFLTVCKPVLPNGPGSGVGFGQIMFNRNVCTGNGDEIDDSLESFPSGHSTAAFAGFLYLYFYLNAKLKVFSNHHASMWKLIVLYAPVLGATLITGSLTIDEYHNWYDCLAGAIIGSVMAISAYRMLYASVWDFRFNHIPLTRHTPFSYGAGEGAGGFESAVFTRAAGWGYAEAYGGAPFDAAHGLRAFNTAGNVGRMTTGSHHNRPTHHNQQIGAATGTGVMETDAMNAGAMGTSTTDANAVNRNAMDTRAMDTRAMDNRAMDNRAMDNRAMDTNLVNRNAADTNLINRNATDTYPTNRNTVDTNAVNTGVTGTGMTGTGMTGTGITPHHHSRYQDRTTSNVPVNDQYRADEPTYGSFHGHSQNQNQNQNQNNYNDNYNNNNNHLPRYSYTRGIYASDMNDPANLDTTRVQHHDGTDGQGYFNQPTTPIGGRPYHHYEKSVERRPLNRGENAV